LVFEVADGDLDDRVLSVLGLDLLEWFDAVGDKNSTARPKTRSESHRRA